MCQFPRSRIAGHEWANAAVLARWQRESVRRHLRQRSIAPDQGMAVDGGNAAAV